MIYYLTYDSIYNSVFESQVLTPLKLLVKDGYPITLVNFDRRIHSNEYLQKSSNYQKESGVAWISLSRLARGALFDHFILENYSHALQKVLKQNHSQEPILIHCRGQLGSYIALKAKERLKSHDIKVISDFRGAMIAEYEFFCAQKGWIHKALLPLSLKRFDEIERYVIQNADQIFCVSHQFKQYILAKGTPAAPVIVIPTSLDNGSFRFAPTLREKKRRELGLEERFVVVYNGGMNLWQMPEYMVQTFKLIKQQIPQAFFLVITKDRAVIEDYFTKYGMLNSDYLIRSCPYHEVKEYLCCGDLGLILRENCLINKISSPTKFAEFLACRVPVLISKNVGDTEEIIKKYQVGLFEDAITDLNSELKKVKKDESVYREVVEKYYSWQSNLQKVLAIYHHLIGNVEVPKWVNL